MKQIPFLALIVSLTCTSWADPLTNPQALRAWARAAKTSRADLVMLGDSNQLYRGYGWNGGYVAALQSSCGLYATGLLWAGEGSGSGMGDGEGYGTVAVGTGGPFSFTNAPVPLLRAVTFRSPISQYLYLEGGPAAGSRNMGMRLEGAFDSSAPIRWWLTDATFPTAGSYRPVIRLGSEPYSVLASFGTVETGGGYGLRTTAYTVPAGARAGPLEFRYAPYAFSADLQGPLLFLWNRCEQVNRRGVSVHTLFAWGGKSARWMAESLGNVSDEFLTAYFSEVRRLQPEQVRVLVRISEGLNDSYETLPSYAGGIVPGNAPAAFIDNIGFAVDRISRIWAVNHWPHDELAFLVSVGHAVDAPSESVQTFIEQYALAAQTYANTHPNVAVVNLSEAVPYHEMIRRGCYEDSSANRFHLSQDGYDQLAAFEVQRILEQPCLADVNQDGGVDGPDLEAFFLSWAACEQAADVNQDGGVDGSDVESFFMAWADGC